jgi:hypothetical protein
MEEKRENYLARVGWGFQSRRAPALPQGRLYGEIYGKVYSQGVSLWGLRGFKSLSDLYAGKA